MSGGRGDLATTEESKKLDSGVKVTSEKIATWFKEHFIRRYILSESEWIKYYGEKCGGFKPDGGFWIDKNTGKVVAVFEAKKEDEGGNAHERWGDNAMTASVMNTDCIYHTFTMGFQKKWKDKAKKSYVEFNNRNLLNTRWSYSEDGYSDEEIEKVMVDTLNEILGKKGVEHIYPDLKREDGHLGSFLDE